MECINCGNLFEGKFCPNCGNKVGEEQRFDFRYLAKEAVNSLDIERGFFNTILILFAKPGLAIRIYINGKRRALYNPVKLLLIWGAIATFLSFNFVIFEGAETPLDFLKLPDHNIRR